MMQVEGVISRRAISQSSLGLFPPLLFELPIYPWVSTSNKRKSFLGEPGLTPQKRKQSQAFRTKHGGAFGKLRSQHDGSYPFPSHIAFWQESCFSLQLSNPLFDNRYWLDLPGQSIWIGLFDKSPFQGTSCAEIVQVERTGGTICSGHICKKVYAVQNWMEEAQHGLSVYCKQKRTLEYQLYLQTHTGKNPGSDINSGI